MSMRQLVILVLHGLSLAVDGTLFSVPPVSLSIYISFVKQFAFPNPCFVFLGQGAITIWVSVGIHTYRYGPSIRGSDY